MPTFRVRITNKDFESVSETDARTANSACSDAVRGGLHIGIDEVCSGKPFFGAEVAIEDEYKAVERMIIAIGVSPLR